MPLFAKKVQVPLLVLVVFISVNIIGVACIITQAYCLRKLTSAITTGSNVRTNQLTELFTPEPVPRTATISTQEFEGLKKLGTWRQLFRKEQQ